MPDDPSSEEALSPRQLEAWRSFLRAHDHLMRTLDADLRASHDMTISEYDVLVQLALADGRRMRMRDLARATLFSPSGLTRLCERLESQGLLVRESCAADLRGTDAVLTRAGANRLRNASATHLRGVYDRFAVQFSDRQLRDLTVVLRRICE